MVAAFRPQDSAQPHRGELPHPRSHNAGFDLQDAGETEEVLAAFRPTHGLQLEPQQADRAPLNIILLAAAAAGVPPNAGDCLVIIKIVMITLLVV